MDSSYRPDNAGIYVCPWFSLADRDELCHRLFEGSREEKLNAIRRLDAWKARSYPRVPMGIEVTLALVEALMLEEYEGKDKPTPFVLTSMLTTALIRFVNLVTEVGRRATKNKSTATINLMAEKMGVPPWIVDLRHEATHSVVPSLHTLKTGVVYALEWVKLKYWAEESEVIEDVIKMPSIYEGQSLQEALHRIKGDLLEMRKYDTGSKNHNAIKDAAKTRITTAMRTIMKSTSSQDLAKLLLSNGLIFPDSKYLRAHIAEIEDDPGLAMHQFYLWWPVLHLIRKCGQLVDLIEALTAEMNRRPGIRAIFASTWITLLLTKFGLLQKLQTKDWKTYIRLIKIVMNKSPCHAHLVLYNLDKDKKEQLSVLASKRAHLISIGLAVSDEPIAVHQRSEERSSEDRKEILSMGCPLGLLPEQLDSTSLDLELPRLVDHIYDRQLTTDGDEPMEDCTVHEEDLTLPRSKHSAAWLL